MRLPRFPRSLSVRTWMAVVLVIGIVLGWKVRHASRQRNAVAVIRQAGGYVFYEPPDPRGASGSSESSRPLVWVRNAIGGDYFYDVSGVFFFHYGQYRSAEPADLGVFAAVGSLDRLEEFLNDHLTADDQALTLLARAANIKRLSLVLHPKAGTGLAHLQGLRHLEWLSLTFPKGMMRSSTLTHVARVSSITTLTLLERGGNAQYPADNLAPLQRMRDLVHLTVIPSPEDGACLAHVRGLTQLGSLSFETTRPSDADLANLAGLAKLWTLVLDFSAITDEGLTHLAALPQLGKLDLSGATRITDAGLERLQRGAPGLHSLSVRGTRISARALDAFHAARFEVALDPDPSQSATKPD